MTASRCCQKTDESIIMHMHSVCSTSSLGTIVTANSVQVQYNAVPQSTCISVQGARIRHRMRQRACKALCSEILEIHHMTEGLNEADTAPEADLRRNLKQHVKLRR